MRSQEGVLPLFRLGWLEPLFFCIQSISDFVLGAADKFDYRSLHSVFHYGTSSNHGAMLYRLVIRTEALKELLLR